MTRLSSPIEKMKSHYTVIVVGSGYGGGIAASRMARAGQSVCLLERGKEFQPGEYPDTEAETLREFQADLPELHVGSKNGLYDFRVNPDIDVFLGCGLGGTSLVNANVSIRAEARVFEDERWPKALRADVGSRLEKGYELAEAMLKPSPYPDTFPPLEKLKAHEDSAKRLNAPFYRVPINVSFADGVNHVGVEQKACVGCGDCVTGCNFGAKNTTLMNYLPDAVNFGAEIYTQVQVRRVARSGDQWLVYYQALGEGREKFDSPDLFVSADVVVLAAGTLGSTELLLRSKQEGLALSDKLGFGFSGNGDVLGFGYNCEREINGVGFGQNPPEGRKPVGPCITSVIDMRNQPELNEGMIIEEGSIPGALAGLLPAGLSLAGAGKAAATDFSLPQLVRQKGREFESLLGGAYKGAVHNTQTYLIMAHEQDSGRMRLQDDRLRIDWPGVGSEPIFETGNERLHEASLALDGVFVHNPMWSPLLRHNLVTVHPLGGCVMAEAAETGVVNHKGQVFAGAAGTAVYQGLYVSDGAVIPRSVGVNPLLTISAVAERCCALMAEDRGWTIDYALPSKPKAAAASAAMGVRFTEAMRGFYAPVADFAEGESAGKDARTSFDFTLTIISEDLENMVTDPRHEARMLGTVIAPGLSGSPLAVNDGEFRLFTENRDQVETRNMIYKMVCHSAEGRSYYFDGFKIIRQNTVFDIWRDTSTLFITLHDGPDPSSPVIGKGILRIRPDDFVRQLTTIDVTNAPTLEDRLRGTARFGTFFAGTLYDVYGGVFARKTEFDPAAPPRKRRPLRVSAPQVYPVRTDDGVDLTLTRYQGGSKGPVMLAHGLGVSSMIFSIDTIETNLLEYLHANGYDVWLLDFRASIALPAAVRDANGDDVAKFDYPAAVKKIREVTGEASVQVVAHCWGATTFTMSMLSGLEGVRSAVCSQISTHVVTPLVTQVKVGLHLPSFLDQIGVHSLTAFTAANVDWREKLLDRALEFYPVAIKERCQSPVCHRISAIYAPLYQHAMLNETTHEVLHEMFGVANIKAFEHLGQMVSKGRVVAADGSDAYIGHLERMAIPMLFVHGAENECFLPESTERAVAALAQRNGKGFYTRRVVPGYGHIDCIFGRDASRDVYPLILDFLESADGTVTVQRARA